jgi:translation elongation factor EF-1beta
MSTKSSDAAGVRPRSVEIDCTVSVPRNAAGDLEAGVCNRLEGVDGVHSIETVGLNSVRPGLNDLTASVTVELRVQSDENLASRLEDRFGVQEAQVLRRKGPP